MTESLLGVFRELAYLDASLSNGGRDGEGFQRDLARLLFVAA
jgi:hypothetical protein